MASPLFQELIGDATSTRSEMNSARLERNKAARTVTATTSTRAKGAAMIAGVGAQEGREEKAEEPRDLGAALGSFAGGGCSLRTPELRDWGLPFPRSLAASRGGTTEGGVSQTSQGLGGVSSGSR